MNHYTQKREEKTKDLLGRVLDILVYADEPITLNDQEYKKISFSQGQVVNALLEHALPQEHIDGIVITDSSTISKNDDYKLMIANAKIKRAEVTLKDSDLSFAERKLTDTEMKVKVDRLIYEKEMLAEKNRMLEGVIKQADLEAFLESEKPLVNEPISIDKRLVGLLEKMLVFLSRDAFIVVDAKRKGKASQVYYFGDNGREFLCCVDELKGLNIVFDIAKNGRITLKEKGVVGV